MRIGLIPAWTFVTAALLTSAVRAQLEAERTTRFAIINERLSSALPTIDRDLGVRMVLRGETTTLFIDQIVVRDATLDQLLGQLRREEGLVAVTGDPLPPGTIELYTHRQFSALSSPEGVLHRRDDPESVDSEEVLREWATRRANTLPAPPVAGTSAAEARTLALKAHRNRVNALLAGNRAALSSPESGVAPPAPREQN
jgi:hypothetical protein